MGRRRAKSSQYRGVTLTKDGGWQAGISPGGHYKYLGVFALARDAAEAYDRAARLYFGQETKLNFPLGQADGGADPRSKGPGRVLPKDVRLLVVELERASKSLGRASDLLDRLYQEMLQDRDDEVQ